jgi:hypothetical protein
MSNLSRDLAILAAQSVKASVRLKKANGVAARITGTVTNVSSQGFADLCLRQVIDPDKDGVDVTYTVKDEQGTKGTGKNTVQPSTLAALFGPDNYTPAPLPTASEGVEDATPTDNGDGKPKAKKVGSRS